MPIVVNPSEQTPQNIQQLGPSMPGPELKPWTGTFLFWGTVLAISLGIALVAMCGH